MSDISISDLSDISIDSSHSTFDTYDSLSDPEYTPSSDRQEILSEEDNFTDTEMSEASYRSVSTEAIDEIYGVDSNSSSATTLELLDISEEVVTEHESEPPNEEVTNSNDQSQDTITNENSDSEEIIPKTISPKRKRILSESPPNSKRSKSDSEDEDEGRICPICFDNWTNTGDHRICSLKCGHLFGYKCLTRWMYSQTKKTCPTCKSKASLKDIRNIYAKKVIATDTNSLEQLKRELEIEKVENTRLSFEVARLTVIKNTHEKTIQQQAAKILELESKSARDETDSSDTTEQITKICFEKSFELTKEDDGCRVMAYNCDSLLVVSVKSPNQLFSDFGIRKINVNDYSVTQFVPLHNKLIRDLAFHPQTDEWLLSVSLDKSAKITNVLNNNIVNHFTTDMPLWSCCWDVNNPNLFYVGTQRGSVLKYDMREPPAAVETLLTPNDVSPVIALASVELSPGQYLPRGGLICCKLSSCWVFENTGTGLVGRKILLEGPFVSLHYNKSSRQILISTRPNPRWVFCRHLLCELETESNEADDGVTVNIVHSYQGGTTQTHLSRNCQINLADDILIACYQETKRQINVWSTKTGNLLQTLATPDPVIDMCYVESKKQFITLTDKRIRVYALK